MFYGIHKCGRRLLIGVRHEDEVLLSYWISLWTKYCPQCDHILVGEDLTRIYEGVEVLSFSGSDPENQALDGYITDVTMKIDGETYVFLVEASSWGPKSAKNWVSKPISTGDIIPNPHICGSRYWNHHCWFQLPEFRGLEEVVRIIRANAAEIARRAADKQYYAG